MHKSRTWQAGLALGLLGLLGAFVGCSGSVANPAGCDVDGKHYAQGDTFPASDGCNHCSCSERGEVQCTLIACEPGPDPVPPIPCTTPDGVTHGLGEQVAIDSCNTCTCTVNGLACTTRACPDAGPSCTELVSELKATLASAQKCESAADCGQRIPESSCGCTRDLIARKDADLSSYLMQRSQARQQGCETGGGSTCDCPNADGYACIDHVCGWNYVGADPDPDPTPVCEHYEAAELCVRGTPTSGGELIEAGDALQVTVRSRGCLSSSCSKVIEASCTIGSGVSFDVEANFCVASTAQPGQGCTADCGTAHANCSFGQPLTAGEHQVKLGSIAVGFQVPSKLPLGGLCASSR